MDLGAGPIAPGRLEMVRAFVNTLDVEEDQDYLDSPSDLDAWTQTHGLAMPSATPDEMPRLIELREALRTVLLAHHNNRNGVDEPAAEKTINAAMHWADVRPTLSAQGLGWSATTDGTAGLVGQLLSTVAAATVEGTWPRLKACHNDTCHWAFYDHSRSRTGRWCSMQVCGNRTKQQRFHQKAASSPQN